VNLSEIIYTIQLIAVGVIQQLIWGQIYKVSDDHLP